MSEKCKHPVFSTSGEGALRCDFCGAVISELEVPSGSAWIRIEQAMPLRCRKVLVSGFYPNEERWRALARWYPAGTLDASMWDDPPESWWNEDDAKCCNPTDGWMEEVIEGEAMWPLENVTHWMELPAMPDADPETLTKK